MTAASASDAADGWIEANGVSLRYRHSGAGPRTLVLVHEMGGTLESWDALLPHLSADQRILRFDLRGSGLSEKLCGPLANPTLDDMAQDLAQLLAALAMNGPVRLAGCAVGARIALAFAARQPTRVAALVAMAPSLDLGAERARNAQASIARVERDGLRLAMRESLERMVAAPLGTDPRVGRTYILRHAANDATSYGAIYRMLLNSQLADQLPSIRCPCLILAGDPAQAGRSGAGAETFQPPARRCQHAHLHRARRILEGPRRRRGREQGGGRDAYQAAARHQTAFYGLLAAERLGLALDASLLSDKRPSDWRQARFANASVLVAGRLLAAAGDRTLAKRFFLHLGESLDDAELAQLAGMAMQMGEPHIAVLIAKAAAERGVILPFAYYPVPDLVPSEGLKVSRALALAIARRESRIRSRRAVGGGCARADAGSARHGQAHGRRSRNRVRIRETPDRSGL